MIEVPPTVLREEKCKLAVRPVGTLQGSPCVALGNPDAFLAGSTEHEVVSRKQRLFL